MGAVANPLVPCIDCGRTVSRQAVACPNCGREIRLGPWTLLLRGGKTALHVLFIFGIVLPLAVVTIYFAVIYAVSLP